MYLGAEEFDGRDVTGNAGEVEWRTTEVIRLLRIEARIDEHLHEAWEAFVGRPVEGGVSIDVSEVRGSSLPQQISRHHGPTEHAGHHQRGQALVVCGVHRHSRLAHENVHHRHVAIATCPVDGAWSLDIVGVVVDVSSVLDQEPDSNDQSEDTVQIDNRPEHMRMAVESQPVGGSVAVLIPLLETVLQPVLPHEPLHLAEGPVSHDVEDVLTQRCVLSLAEGLPAVPLLFFAVPDRIVSPTSTNIVIVILECGK